MQGAGSTLWWLGITRKLLRPPILAAGGQVGETDAVDSELGQEARGRVVAATRRVIIVLSAVAGVVIGWVSVVGIVISSCEDRRYCPC